MNILHVVIVGGALLSTAGIVAGSLLLYRGLRSLADAVAALGDPEPAPTRQRPSPRPKAPTPVVRDFPTALWPTQHPPQTPRGWNR